METYHEVARALFDNMAMTFLVVSVTPTANQAVKFVFESGGGRLQGLNTGPPLPRPCQSTLCEPVAAKVDV